MEEEPNMIDKNNTWNLVDPPKGKDIISLNWVYKTKYNEDGSIQKHKAILVAKGYSHSLEYISTKLLHQLQELRQSDLFLQLLPNWS